MRFVASDQRTSRHPLSLRVSPEQRQRVGAFVRSRRRELKMSQPDLARTLGYKQVTSISAIETGKEALGLDRAYAWADVLEVDRSAFFLFVTGQREHMEPVAFGSGEALSDEEQQIIASYRKLPRHHQIQLRDTALALALLVHAATQKG